MENNQDSHQSADPDIRENIEKLKKAIWKRRPILGEIMQKHGHNTLYEYSQQYLDVNTSSRLDTRKPQLIAVVKELVSARLGTAVGDSVARQLTKLPLVSTADHHTLIQHPFFVNANVIFSIPFVKEQNVEIENLIVFSASSISLNNSSGFARGLMFHGQESAPEVMTRLPLLAEKYKMVTVYNAPAYGVSEVERAKKVICDKLVNKLIDSNVADKLIDILDRIFKSKDILAAKDLCTQFTKLNYIFWPLLFNGGNEFGEKKVPNLIYLEIETLVSELLTRFHIEDQNSLLYKLIFSKKYQDLMVELFDDLPGAFSSENNSGTFLFWATDQNNHRVRLLFQDGILRSEDKKIIVPLNPGEIKQLLINKKIFPSMSFCYLVVSLFYGMKCLGGFCQVHDLTVTKEAWQALLDRVGEVEESKAVAPVQTKEFGGCGVVLAYSESKNDNLTPATGWDLLMNASGVNFQKYISLSKKMTLTEIMDPMLPEMYSVSYPIFKRDPVLVATTVASIMRLTKLEDKIKFA